MKVEVLTPKQWLNHARDAHLICFNEIRQPYMDRIDYALVCVNGRGIPMAYQTCKELDAESVYIQYGGAFPSNSPINRVETFRLFLEWYSKKYKRVSFLVENTNRAMLKLALKFDFLIIGVRVFKNYILLEHGLEFNKGE